VQSIDTENSKVSVDNSPSCIRGNNASTQEMCGQRYSKRLANHRSGRAIHVFGKVASNLVPLGNPGGVFFAISLLGCELAA
jgi:hypothetical protein